MEFENGAKEGKDEKIRQLGLRERFMAQEYTLHIRCFYDGEYTINTVREELERSKQHIDDITNLFRLNKYTINLETAT
ncbi:MAG: hypothetical protein ACUVTD_01655 [Nitrososphaerales archaeon]